MSSREVLTDARRVADAAGHFVDVAACTRGRRHVALTVDGHCAHRVARAANATVRVVAVCLSSASGCGLAATGGGGRGG